MSMDPELDSTDSGMSTPPSSGDETPSSDEPMSDNGEEIVYDPEGRAAWIWWNENGWSTQQWAQYAVEGGTHPEYSQADWEYYFSQYTGEEWYNWCRGDI